ncbi:SusC/RagA family TonB-linked outer membrane protein [Echinicola pacifica]|nr:SusC/RagA family TonB-linked outer membrane protein [Echinicola pacifica]
MNAKNIKWICCAWILFMPLLARAQSNPKISLSPKVISNTGEPIYGAVATSDQDQYSAVSDTLGIVELEVSLHAYLGVEAPGYETKLLQVSRDLQQIVLFPYLEGETVQLPFQTKDKRELSGGIDYVNMPEVLDQNYLTYPLDGMEAYVGGYNGNLWGNDSYLTLVDGVPRDIGSVMPTEIAQITFLKGVSALALYGSRAAKGVLLITTKRGVTGRQEIQVRANAGIHVPKSFPQYLGSSEYMSLYNEARTNDGLSPLYSQEDIYQYSTGENPYRYPNVDYYSEDYLQEAYSRYDATMEISGGNESARYYTNVGFWTQGSLLDFGQAQDNATERFNIRGNVDLDLNEYISAKVDASAIFYNGKGVNTDYWGGASRLRPYRFTPLIPIDMINDSDQASLAYVESSDHIIDGKYLLGGTQLDQTNPIADIYAGGSNKFTSRQFQFNAGLNGDLQNLLEGLSFSGQFGLDYSTRYNLSYSNEYAVYQPFWTNYNGEDEIASLTKYGQDASSRTQNIYDNWFRQTLAFSAQLNYTKQIDRVHTISAMLVANGFQTAESGIYHKISNATLGVYGSYSYKQKYYADFSGALSHSARLAEGNRDAFSPTLSLAWRLSEEDFLKSSSVIDDLKLSVSGGILHTDLDIDDYYLYEAIYTDDGSWYSWKDGLNNTATDVRRGENPDLTFPKREEISLGVDGVFFNNLITISGSYFWTKMTGLFVQNNILYPSYFTTGWPVSSWIPYVNYNDDLRKGLDFKLNLHKKIGQVDWNVGISGLYYSTQASKRSENYENGYQVREGKPLDAIWGLEAIGFFEGLDDIENSPSQAFGEVKPGDIKYKDQNNDGLVNDQDQVYLGRGGWSGAPLTMGFNLSAKVKNLTFFALGTLRSGAFAMRNSNYFWVNGDDKYSEIVRGRWTEETKAEASFPRLTTQSGTNNFRSSDFWVYSTNRFDLDRVQVSYTFPEQLFGQRFLKGLDLYVNAANLLTIAPNRDILELNVGSAPQTRFYNLGLKAKF